MASDGEDGQFSREPVGLGVNSVLSTMRSHWRVFSLGVNLFKASLVALWKMD